jgi:hypothetical protein
VYQLSPREDQDCFIADGGGKGRTSMMSCWKITGLGLLLGGLAAACTITSDDDTGTGGSSANSSGGSATGATGATGATAGTSSSTGGTAGSTSGGGAGGSGGASNLDATESVRCDTCLSGNCNTDTNKEYANCLANTRCWTEFNVLRNCAIASSGNEAYDVKVDGCIFDIYGGPSNLTPETTAILACALDTATSCDPCFESDSPDAG